MLTSVRAMAFTSVGPLEGTGTSEAATGGDTDSSSRAGAADPMITMFAFGAAFDCGARAPSAANAEISAEASAFGLFLRAESAANGDTGFDRAEVEGATEAEGSVRRKSAGEVSAGLGAVRIGPGLNAAASLNNCSIGSRRCACAIFSNPSS